jgi:hypothetical protein
MGNLTYYVEAFIESPSNGYHWRVFNNGEGMIEFDYQEHKDGQWHSLKFQGWPSSEIDALIKALDVVRNSPV